jgi:5-methylcytosine-specific restriction endonuclease McrA
VYRPCLICGSPSIPGGSRCQAHTRSNWGRYKATNPNASVYASPQWRERSKQQLAEYPYCAQCGAPAAIADHIHNMAAGGDPKGPLQSLCRPCHSRKTSAEGGRAAKQKRQQQ